MAAIADTRYDRIKELVCKHLEVSPDELTDDSLFIEDHGADSLGLIDVLAALEKEFDISIDQADISRMVNLRSVYEVASESAGW